MFIGGVPLLPVDYVGWPLRCVPYRSLPCWVDVDSLYVVARGNAYLVTGRVRCVIEESSSLHSLCLVGQDNRTTSYAMVGKNNSPTLNFPGVGTRIISIL